VAYREWLLRVIGHRQRGRLIGRDDAGMDFPDSHELLLVVDGFEDRSMFDAAVLVGTERAVEPPAAVGTVEATPVVVLNVRDRADRPQGQPGRLGVANRIVVAEASAPLIPAFWAAVTAATIDELLLRLVGSTLTSLVPVALTLPGIDEAATAGAAQVSPATPSTSRRLNISPSLTSMAPRPTGALRNHRTFSGIRTTFVGSQARRMH